MRGQHIPRLAVNPIAYWIRDGKVNKSREVFETAFADCQKLGYTAVKADIFAEMTAAQYLEWIGSYGLAPSVSLFNSALDETVDIAIDLEKARHFAAQQASLGMDRAMVSSMMIPARMAPDISRGPVVTRLPSSLAMPIAWVPST